MGEYFPLNDYEENFEEQSSVSLDVLEQITNTDSVEELMQIARDEWVFGNQLLAVKCFHKAAEHGSAKAQRLLAECYEIGIGVTKDEECAVKWYTKAAIQKEEKALCNLAGYYYSGNFVEKNEALAEAMLLLSAKQKHSRECLKSWYNVDIRKDKAYCYHESLDMAKQMLEMFILENTENKK